MEQTKKITHKKILTGVVVSNKMDKTIVVKVSELSRHPLYGKIIRKSKKVKAHDERNECHLNDVVRVIECRPLSKEKCWRLLELVERAK
ncbi:MAG: 30S ribosomal protein S17 [Spirochaetota bacterium]|jgi:small subunit ribosomal protein S17|nr:30S ribosomal protein S17 [Spirochaetota bacterium]